MRVDGIDLNTNVYFLEMMGLDRFTPKTVDDNSKDRGVEAVGKPQAQRDEETGNRRWLNVVEKVRRLNIRKNKFDIMALMNRGMLLEILPFLSKDQMVEAMGLFPRMMLVRFIGALPKDMILKMLLWLIPLEKFLKMFQTKVLFAMLQSKRLDVKDMVAGFEFLPEDALQKLMSDVTQRNCDKIKKNELLSMFRQLDKELIMDALKKMPQKYFQEFVFQVVKKDPELMMNIPRGELIDVIGKLPKPLLVQLFQLLPEDMLVQYLSKLPEKSLLLAVAQMDDNIFAYLLSNKFADFVNSILPDAA